MRLTAEQKSYWSKYLVEMARALDLADWTFLLKTDLIEDEADDENKIYGAQVDFIDGRRRATIRLGEAFITRSARHEQRQIIAHELIHCHFGAAWRHVEYDLEVFLGKPTFTAFFNSFERNMEHGIDAVAEALARHLPLPPVPKPVEPRRRKVAKQGGSATRKQAMRNRRARVG